MIGHVEVKCILRTNDTGDERASGKADVIKIKLK